MFNVVAINGSPRMVKGNTAMILDPFLDELENQGAAIDLFYPSKLQIKPCNCGRLYCWNDSPGECIHHDAMQKIYPALKKSNLLVFATPIYIPIPGEMQKFINRLTPLLDPKIEFRNGRTGAQFREDVQIDKVVLLATGGWWEKENLDRATCIVEEFAAVANVSFGGAILRPHAHLMVKDGQLTKNGQAVIQEIRLAAQELVESGDFRAETLEKISQPLISKEAYFNR